MARLYVSYKNEDGPLAKAFAEQLELLGHTAVYDAVAVEPGSNWRDVLLRSLVGCDAVIVLLTERALNSHFVMGEIGAARTLHHMNGRTLLLPVLIGEVGIPSVISDLFTVRMPSSPTDAAIKDATVELVGALLEHLERSKRGYPKIFISHRHSDVAAVQALVNVLVAAFDVQPTDLRCTSVHPYRLKAGDRTADRLRAELQRAEAVLGIISPDVKASSYVLFELGASWGRAGLTLPLLARGATAADVPAPIGDLHTLSLLDEAECHQLIDDLADVVSLKRQTKQGSLIAQKVADLVKAASQ